MHWRSACSQMRSLLEASYLAQREMESRYDWARSINNDQVHLTRRVLSRFAMFVSSGLSEFRTCSLMLAVVINVIVLVYYVASPSLLPYPVVLGAPDDVVESEEYFHGSTAADVAVRVLGALLLLLGATFLTLFLFNATGIIMTRRYGCQLPSVAILSWAVLSLCSAHLASRRWAGL
jgi:hypothetical protein